MRKSLVIAASLGSLIASSAAFAATDASGVVKSIDAKTKSITLADGKTYLLPDKFDAKTLKVGEKVTISYDVKNNKMWATSVKPAS